MSRKVDEIKVIRLPKPDNIKSFVEDFMDDYKNGKITDAIFTYRKKEGNKVYIKYYWIGEESSLLCLGLVHHLGTIIEDYIREREVD